MRIFVNFIRKYEINDLGVDVNAGSSQKNFNSCRAGSTASSPWIKG